MGIWFDGYEDHKIYKCFSILHEMLQIILKVEKNSVDQLQDLAIELIKIIEEINLRKCTISMHKLLHLKYFLLRFIDLLSSSMFGTENMLGVWNRLSSGTKKPIETKINIAEILSKVSYYFDFNIDLEDSEDIEENDLTKNDTISDCSSFIDENGKSMVLVGKAKSVTFKENEKISAISIFFHSRSEANKIVKDCTCVLEYKRACLDKSILLSTTKYKKAIIRDSSYIEFESSTNEKNFGRLLGIYKIEFSNQTIAPILFAKVQLYNLESTSPSPFFIKTVLATKKTIFIGLSSVKDTMVTFLKEDKLGFINYSLYRNARKDYTHLENILSEIKIPELIPSTSSSSSSSSSNNTQENKSTPQNQSELKNNLKLETKIIPELTPSISSSSSSSSSNNTQENKSTPQNQQSELNKLLLPKIISNTVLPSSLNNIPELSLSTSLSSSLSLNNTQENKSTPQNEQNELKLETPKLLFSMPSSSTSSLNNIQELSTQINKSNIIYLDTTITLIPKNVNDFFELSDSDSDSNSDAIEISSSSDEENFNNINNNNNNQKFKEKIKKDYFWDRIYRLNGSYWLDENTVNLIILYLMELYNRLDILTLNWDVLMQPIINDRYHTLYRFIDYREHILFPILFSNHWIFIDYNSGQWSVYDSLPNVISNINLQRIVYRCSKVVNILNALSEITEKSQREKSINEIEWDSNEIIPFKIVTPIKQMNDFDCGVHMLMNIESTLKNDPEIMYTSAFEYRNMFYQIFQSYQPQVSL